MTCKTNQHLEHKSCHCCHHTHAVKAVSWSLNSVAAVGHRPAHYRSHRKLPTHRTAHVNPLQMILETKDKIKQREVKTSDKQIFKQIQNNPNSTCLVIGDA